MGSTIPTEIWVLMVRRSDIPYLNRSLAGLNLVERHIRESKKWNIRQILFWMEPPQMPYDQALIFEFERVLSHLLTKPDHNFVRVIRKIEDLSVHEAELAMAAPHLSLFSHQWVSKWSVALHDYFKKNASFENVWKGILELPEMDEWKEAKNHTVFYIPLTKEKDWGWALRRLGVEIVEQTRSGFLGKILNRKISLWMSRFLVHLDWPPYIWTFLNLVFGGIASLLMLSQESSTRCIGALLFYWSCIFDGVDGEVARLKFETSENGALLDMASSWINTLFFYGALLFGLALGGSMSVTVAQYLFLSVSVLAALLSVYFVSNVETPIGQGAWPDWEKRYSQVLRHRNLTLLFRKETFAAVAAIVIVLGLDVLAAWGALAGLLFAWILVADVEWRTRRVLVTEPRIEEA